MSVADDGLLDDAQLVDDAVAGPSTSMMRRTARPSPGAALPGPRKSSSRERQRVVLVGGGEAGLEYSRLLRPPLDHGEVDSQLSRYETPVAWSSMPIVW